MAKKYLSLEEVMDRLNMTADQISRMRETGQLRGFADRGTWKFKSEEIEEFARSRQADSDPEVPLLGDLGLGDEELPDGQSAIDQASSILGMDAGLGLDEVGDDQDPATIISGSVLEDIDDDLLDLSSSDSDVRLIIDEGVSSISPDSDLDIAIPSLGDSDSDVRLTGDEQLGIKGSDSDVKLVGTGHSIEESDSDVQLTPDSTKSDIGQSDSDVSMVGDDSSLVLDEEPSESDSATMTLGGSGIDLDDALEQDDPSSIALEANVSGIILEGSQLGGMLDMDPEDSMEFAEGSGITLEPEDSDADSGITLGVDSGIALEEDLDGKSGLVPVDDADSGISLLEDSGTPGDSGIEVNHPADSGIALEEALGATVSMPMTDDIPSDIPSGTGSVGEKTEMEFDGFDDDMGDSEFELSTSPGDTEDEANVILFDDEDDTNEDAATFIKTGADETDEFEDSEEFDLEDDDEFDEEFEEFEEGEGEEEFEEDVFDADDEDFDEDLQQGESQADFAPMPVAAGPVEYDFGTFTFIGLLMTCGTLAVCGMLMFDLLRSMWGYQEPNVFSSTLLDTFKGLF
ncbi:helix-turn-helix domain-containing protein [Calycomorphotria hydatis]|uniref:Helix-turn-helix domain protein n=1 Tax=Calycomorphotria hydatis TaxID=2528027 RepID=A0A517T834_9PLAN|nr:helix-turn-helix domain-containing protein [Calycomorphotria hydatis]QDT64530.1 hypothetical protein V22_17650 [Calycomorphotria hydatis]